MGDLNELRLRYRSDKAALLADLGVQGSSTRGVRSALQKLSRLTDQTPLVEQVMPLVREHARPAELHAQGASDAAVRRLAQRVGRIDRLVRVARADRLGRPPLVEEDFPAGPWLLGKAAALGVAMGRPVPLIQGRHLVALGMEPGPRFAPLLQACFEAQLEGTFTDETAGLSFLRSLLGQS